MQSFNFHKGKSDKVWIGFKALQPKNWSNKIWFRRPIVDAGESNPRSAGGPALLSRIRIVPPALVWTKNGQQFEFSGRNLRVLLEIKKRGHLDWTELSVSSHHLSPVSFRKRPNCDLVRIDSAAANSLLFWLDLRWFRRTAFSTIVKWLSSQTSRQLRY